MKVLVDTSVLSQLETTYGTKAQQALWTALKNISEEKGDLIGMTPLRFEDIVRHQKISQRKSVALMEDSRDILLHLNRMAGKNFRPVDTNLKPIAALLKTYDKNNILGVIDNKVAKWKGTSFEDYIRPSTLFRPSNFEAYVNETVAPEIQDKNFAAELDGMFQEAK